MDKYISTQSPPAVSRGGIIIVISMCLPQNGVYSSSSTLISVEMLLRCYFPELGGNVSPYINKRSCISMHFQSVRHFHVVLCLSTISNTTRTYRKLHFFKNTRKKKIPSLKFTDRQWE